MIRKVDYKRSVNAIFLVDDALVVDEGPALVAGNRKLMLNMTNGYRHGNGVLSILDNGSISLYDKNFSLLRTVSDPTFTVENAGIEAFTGDEFVIFRFIKANHIFIYQGGKMVSETENFWGKVVSPAIRLNYREGTWDNPTYFRCSDMADAKTYFEFQCGEGEEVIRQYVHVDDSLFFPMVTKDGLRLMEVDVRSGVTLWNPKIEFGSFNVDIDQRHLVSVGSTANDRKLRYQIVDLRNRTVAMGIANELITEHNVRTPHYLQHLYGNYMYFAENRRSYTGKKPNPVRFGRMNLLTKSIDVIEEITEEITQTPGSQILQIIEHEQRIYVRNLEDELFIYEQI
jgi:hypothetical protein